MVILHGEQAKREAVTEALCSGHSVLSVFQV